MTAATLQPIEIFRPGRHKDAHGAVLEFSEGDLAQAARVYDPALYRAPLVVGHPKNADLAYGHVAALQVNAKGNRLVAKPAQVEPEFAELVAAGRLLAVSASFYMPDSPNNPVPGNYYLRHVGFLGAEAPAIKGLKPPTVQFAEGEQGVVEFGDWADTNTASLFRGLRDWVIGKFGLEEAEKALPSWTVQSLADEAARPQETAVPTNHLAYSEGNNVTTVTPEKLAADAAQLSADRLKLDQDRQAFEVRERATLHKARVAEFSEFTGGLVKAGRLLPLHQASLLAVMAALPDTQVVEFAEGDATVNKPAVQVLRDFLGQLPKVVDFTERARDTAAGKTDAVDFSDPMSIHAAATAFIAERAKAGQEVPHHEAVVHVMRQAEQA